MNILMLGGTWNTTEGKPSGIINKIHTNLIKLMSNIDHITFYNGGNYNELIHIINTVTQYDVVFWLANVPNYLPKIRNVKEINPNVLFIGSKQNLNNKYPFVEVLNRTLLQKHNLTILFEKNDNDTNYHFTLFDPLGTSWYSGKDITNLTNEIYKRISFLLTMTRKHTYPLNNLNIDITPNIAFIDYIHEVAEVFHNTIQHTEGATRFLGNASYRGPYGIIYTSEREVDKAVIDNNHFVPTFTDFKTDKTYYFGNKKPSKDAIVQTYLYKMFPYINYIIHSHCYVENGIWTETPVPCGSLNEIDELKLAMKQYKDNYNGKYYIFNLKGHGMLLMASTIEQLRQTKYIPRILPETITH